MDFKKIFQHTLAAVWLIITAAALTATSYGSDSVSYGTFDIISDCVSPVLSDTIVTVGGVITDPLAVSYTDFGFPQATVDGDEVVGVIGLVVRSCKRTYGDSHSNKDWVYSCFDDGQFSCTIALSEH